MKFQTQFFVLLLSILLSKNVMATNQQDENYEQNIQKLKNIFGKEGEKIFPKSFESPGPNNRYISHTNFSYAQRAIINNPYLAWVLWSETDSLKDLYFVFYFEKYFTSYQINKKDDEDWSIKSNNDKTLYFSSLEELISYLLYIYKISVF